MHMIFYQHIFCERFCEIIIRYNIFIGLLISYIYIDIMNKN